MNIRYIVELDESERERLHKMVSQRRAQRAQIAAIETFDKKSDDVEAASESYERPFAGELHDDRRLEWLHFSQALSKRQRV